MKTTESEVDDVTTKRREDYAKMALLMFYPYQKLDDIKCNGAIGKSIFMNSNYIRRVILENFGQRDSKFYKTFKIGPL